MHDLSWILFSREQRISPFAMIPIPLEVFKSSLDESADQLRERLFVAAGLIGFEGDWKPIEKRWGDILDEHQIAYFKTSECKTLDGEFRKYRSVLNGREIANQIRGKLENVLISSHLGAFGLAIVMQDYLQVLREVPEAKSFYEDDPSAVPAFYHLIYEINRTIRRKAKGSFVAFLYDDSPVSEKINHAFSALRQVHPVSSRSMVTLAPLDDRNHPALQAADMWADIARQEVYEPWLAHGRHRIEAPEGWKPNVVWMGMFDREYLLYTIQKNLSNPRFKNGLLPTREMGRNQQRRNKRKSRI